MAYVPDPTDVTQPTEDKLAQTAAAEFRALKAYVQSIVSGGGPGAQTPGQVAYFPGSIAPPGYLSANGSLVLRATYPALWAIASVLGAVVSEVDWSNGAWGGFSVGDGSTTFRLPELRGEFPRGLDLGRGADPGRAANTRQLGSSVSDYIHADNSGSLNANGIQTVVMNDDGVYAETGDPRFLNYLNAASAANGGPAYARFRSLRPRNVALHACIKT